MKNTASRLITVRFLLAATIAGLLLGAHQRLASHQEFASQGDIAPCEPINAQLDGTIVPCDESPVGFCAIGTVSNGLLKGSKEAVYNGASPSAGMPNVEPASTLSYSATQVFHTDKGDLHMSVVGVSDNARLVFTEICRITGGTGRFSNATGNLFISGTFAPDGINFQSRITGEICLVAPASISSESTETNNKD
jgi:hypothetical protein